MAADARLQSIGWRLARGNAAFCAETSPAAGLLLLDAANYADPAQIRAALGLAGAVAVDAVAQGSPAALAGLRGGEEVTAIEGEPVSALPARAAADSERIEALHLRIEQALAARGSVSLTLADGRTLAIPGEPACRARFLVSEGGSQAGADEHRVRLSQAALAAAGDDEASAIVAHELAHVILSHRRRLAAGTLALRESEREADRLAPWLLANAGLDPAAMLRLARAREGRLPSLSHGSWKARGRAIEAELAAIAALGPAPLDWRRRFAW